MDKGPPRGERIHGLDILDTTTAALEFVSRMARQFFKDGQVEISFELNLVAGRRLTWPLDHFHYRIDSTSWCQRDSIVIDEHHDCGALALERRSLALDVAEQLYREFGWRDAPRKGLEEEQTKRFGACG